MRLKKILIADPRPCSREGLKSVLGMKDYSIIFSDAGNDQEFIRATQHCKVFDLILVHADFLLPGKHGLITSYLYKTDNLVMLICDEVTDDMDVKLKFFNIAGVIKNTDPIEKIETNVLDIMALQGLTGYFSQPCYREIKESYADEKALNEASGVEQPFSKGNLAYLTKRQDVVLNYLKVGLMNKEIAFEMGIQESTVKRHVYDIFKKLQVKNRTQLAVYLNY